MYESNKWLERMRGQHMFERFMSIHPMIKPAIIWKCSSKHLCFKTSKNISQIWIDVSPKIARVCKFCEYIYTDLYLHITTSCPLTQSARNDFCELVYLNYGQRMYDKLINGENEDIYRCLLGKYPIELNNEQFHEQFCRDSYKYIVACIYTYRTSK